MIDPTNITIFNRTEAELQEFLLFCIMVHGKKSSVQAVKLEGFLTYLAHVTGCDMPFEMVNYAMNIEEEEEESLLYRALQKFKLGQYGRLCRAIEDMIRLPGLREVTVEQLENCFAIGPKSARFFLVHSRPNQQYAVLDVHILRWLRKQGINAPKNTPQGKWYEYFEKIFLTFVSKAEESVATFDLKIWNKFAVNS